MSANNPSNPFEMFGENNSPKPVKLFSDELISLKGKIIELYIGDESASYDFEEFSVRQNSSIFGELVEVLDRFIIIKCLFLDRNNQLQFGNKIYINAFQIRAMCVLDGQGSLQDISLNVRDAKKVRELIKSFKG